ncbi:TonB-dependent receptor [Chitinophaga costaii]|nr:TonB-dependent receptor [Chitinophaga costaii]
MGGLLGWMGVMAQTYTISGYLRDSTNGETLIGATVALKNTSKGVQSNHYGFYALQVAPGDYTLVFSYLGYQTQEHFLHVDRNLQLSATLWPAQYQAREVVVTSKRKDENVKNTDMGRVELTTAQAQKLPALMGEVDILKSLQLMPGIQSAGEGNAGFYVRGGGSDQNLILLDEAPVYNTGHLFGFFSVFNADAIKSTTLIKGGMPANYGGRLSSVVDITMKDGNNKQFQGEGGIGFIASRLSLQGPIKKNKASFMVSGRRTYIDLLVKPFVAKSSSFYGSGYYFYDLNAKANYTFSDKNRLYLSAYLGRDVFNFVNGQRNFNVHIPWGNTTATLRWNHVYSQRLFSNTSFLYNDYSFSFGASENSYKARLNSAIRDVNGKMDFDYFASFKHHLKFGGNYIYHTFIPSSVTGGQDSTVFNPDNPFKKNAHEVALYVLDDWEISNSLQLNVGLRYSGFQQVGPYKYYIENSIGAKTDSITYNNGQFVKYYGGLEPRLTLRFAWNNRNSIKLAYNRNNQYIHLVSNSGTTLPTDIWVPSTWHVKPQVADQYALGYFLNFDDNTWETSVETYYKYMQNQVEYRQGYTPTIDDPEQDFVFGKGWSYGSEFFIHKIKGRLTGWIGYTLAWTWRLFPDLNDAKKFPAKYDRRHDLSVVGMYELNEHWSFSGVFIFATGNTTTLPEHFFFIENTLVQQTGAINAYRLPAYHRLDLSAIYKPRKHPNRRVQGSWAFSIYNAYSRQNPYFLYFDQSGSPQTDNLKVTAKQVSLFPIIPSVTWNFKF